jgi:hypothetical protein
MSYLALAVAFARNLVVGGTSLKRTRAMTLVAGLVLVPLFTTAEAKAALFTLDLRLPGGGKSYIFALPGTVVTLEVYAQIQNNDGNRANDGFLQSQFSLLSTEGPSDTTGDLAPLTLNAAVLDVAVSAPGTAQNLDLAPDLEVGSNVPGTGAAWVVANAGTSTKFASGMGTGPTEFLLGTTTWTSHGQAFLEGPLGSLLNVGLRQNTSTLSAGRNYQFTSDGIAYALRWDGRASDGTFLANAVAVGSPVGVPEPALLGAFGLLGLSWTIRKRCSRR